MEAEAHAYREVFPLMIQSWRQVWGQGDFPFYWTQLADYMNEVDTPGDSSWAELRESQTLSLQKLRKVGEAVIIDAGEGRDIHPRNKQIVANRLLGMPWSMNTAIRFPTIAPHTNLMKSSEIKSRSLLIKRGMDCTALILGHLLALLYVQRIKNLSGPKQNWSEKIKLRFGPTRYHLQLLYATLGQITQFAIYTVRMVRLPSPLLLFVRIISLYPPLVNKKL